MSDAKDIKTFEDLQTDNRNLNKGTKRGLDLLEKSVERFGAGRSILADRNGNIIAGNKTALVASEKGIPIEVVRTDGRTLIVVQRTDVDLETPEGRALALADNRVSELDLDWDIEELAAMKDEGVPIDDFFFPDELEKLTEAFEVKPTDAPMLKSEDRLPFQGMTFTLHDSQVAIVKSALARAQKEGGGTSEVNDNSNGNAIAWLCERYLNG